MKERHEALRKRAAELPKDGWTVGRTDLRSWDHNGMPEHYAYPPTGDGRVKFSGIDHVDALRKALQYAEKQNRQPRKADTPPLTAWDRKFIKLCEEIVAGEAKQKRNKQPKEKA